MPNPETNTRALAPDSVNEAVHSADGTRIGFTRVGSGTVPVVIVHGALNSGEQWMSVASAMAEDCTCYVMDRWGRGGSGDHADYTIEREVEDILAVLEVAGSGAFLFAHSSGAIYALEAARRTEIAGLILYEPPLHAFHGRFVDEIWGRIRAAAEEERMEDAVAIFVTEEGGMPEEALSQFKTTPRWDHMVALAPQSVREWEALVQARFTVERYNSVSAPTLLLTGTETANHPSFATEALERTLADARVVTLEGQGHTANLAAPALVADAVSRFLAEAAR